MKILCIICSQDIPEEQYAGHMQSQHPEGQISAMQKQKLVKQNLPNQSAGLPPGITDADLPDEEFLKTVAEIEKAQQKPAQPTPKPQEEKPPHSLSSNPATPPAVVSLKPIQLTYRYEGVCDKGHPVSTLEIDIHNSHHVIAYCTVCKIQCQEREVEDLDKQKIYLVDKNTKEITGEIELPKKIIRMPSLKKLPGKKGVKNVATNV